MFKVPDWEEDIPKTNINFVKDHKINKKKKNKKAFEANKDNTKLIKSHTTKANFNSHSTNKLNQNKNNQTNTETRKFSGHSPDIIKTRISKKKNKNTTKRKLADSNIVVAKKRNLSETDGVKIQNYDKDNLDVKNKHKTKINGHLNKIDNDNNQTNPEKINLNGHTTENLKSYLSKKKNKHSRKNKLTDSDNVITEVKKLSESERVEIQNYDTDKLDEILLNAEKKKLNDTIQNEDSEETLFSNQETNHVQSNICNNGKKKLSDSHSIIHSIQRDNAVSDNSQNRPKLNKKKELIKSLLQKESHRNHITVKENGLRERMLERLKAAQFRYLNEKLYTSSGSEAQKLFQSDPVAFHTYHQGYQQQVKKWPVNPLDLIVKKIMKMPKTHFIADMGCGEAALSKRLPNKVRSFDLVAANDSVEACDMAHTPLLSASVDVAVYCLALMGSDLTQYLVEANRVLKVGGHLLIAEVESRFDEVEVFAREVQRLGFKLKELDKSHQVFFFLEFVKTQDPPVKKSKLPMLTLKPCLYKRR